MMEDLIKENSSKYVSIVKDPSLSSSRPPLGRGRGKQQMNYFSSTFSLRRPLNENKLIFSSRLNSMQNPITTDRDNFIQYSYRKPFTNEHLSYLLGPGRERIGNDILPYLSLGYCRVKSIEQGKEIEQFLYDILPDSLDIQVLKIKEDLALVVSSSAAEKFFEESSF